MSRLLRVLRVCEITMHMSRTYWSMFPFSRGKRMVKMMERASSVTQDLRPIYLSWPQSHVGQQVNLYHIMYAHLPLFLCFSNRFVCPWISRQLVCLLASVLHLLILILTSHGGSSRVDFLIDMALNNKTFFIE